MSAIGTIGGADPAKAKQDVSWNTWTFGVGLTIF